MLLLAQTEAVRAEDDDKPSAMVPTAELRLEDVDLAQGFRTDAGALAPRPFSTAQTLPDQDLDGPPAEDAAPDPSSTESPPSAAPAIAARPNFGLFDGPAPASADRQNPAIAAVAPAAPDNTTSASQTVAPFDPSRAPSLFAAPNAAPPSRPADPATLAANPAGSLGTSGLLSTAPIRPSRLDQTGSRLNLRTLPLRSPFPFVPGDPFGPVGLRLGSFLLYSAVEQSVGVSSNLESSAGGSSGAFSDTALSARFVSNWSRHAAELNGLANYRRNFSGEVPSQPDVAVNGLFRLDIDRATTALLEGGIDYRREDDSDLDTLVDTEERRDRFAYRGTAALEHSFGHAFVRGSLSAIRETVSGGGTLASSLDDDFDTYAGALRFGYRLTPAFAPFAEAGLGRRVFDEDRRLGIERDSLIETLRGGVSFDFGEKLNGEIAIGYAGNRPDADALSDIAAPTFDAQLNWSPRRGTDIALTAATTFDPDPLGASTATLYQAGIAAQHRATSRLALTAALTGGYRDSELSSDVERTWDVSLGFNYWLNRSVALTGLASHRDVDRNTDAADYDVNSVKLGIRVQN